MVIHYTPALVEGVVLEAIRRQEAMGHSALSAEYHRLVDPIYERPAVERDALFHAVHVRLFEGLKFGESVWQALGEYPDLTGRVEAVVVTTATRRDEGADLSRESLHPSSAPTIVIKVRPERFFDPSRFRRFLRHELMHIQDMLDPAFGLTPESRLPDGSPTEITMLKDRYRMLWDLSIDARLVRIGKETVSGRDERYVEFRVLYRKLDPTQVETVFAWLWQTDRPSHEELVGMARDVRTLLERIGCPAEDPRSGPRTPMPGASCPLCRFSTFDWAEDVETLPEEALDAILADYPEWTPDEGACERCIEAYRARVGLWL